MTVTFLLTSLVICVGPGTGTLVRLRRVFAACFLALGGRLALEAR